MNTTLDSPPSDAVRFGCCAGPGMAEAVAKAGFDFIELPAASSLQPETDGDLFAPSLAQLEKSPLPIEAFNIFLPGDLKIVGEAVDRERIHHYLHRVMDRAAAVGGKVIVFGSARSRNVPDGFDPEDAWGQIEVFLSEAGPIAESYGITIAIEPLNRGESNILNTVPQAVDLAKAVDHPHVKALADSYHMAKDGEPLSNLRAAQGWLAHVHVSDDDRRAPGLGANALPELFRLLHETGYSGRISVECNWQDFETEAPAAAAYLHETWERSTQGA